VTLSNVTLTGTNLTFSIQTVAGDTYTVEYTDNVVPANWQVLMMIPGDGAMKEIVLPRSAVARRFFRVAVQ